MSTYKIAEGHGVALVSLTDINPQPRSAGVKAARRTYAADSTIHDEGLHIVLVFDFVDDATALDDLLDQFGLDVATSANVTIYCPNQVHSYARYNGTALRPEVSRDNYFLRGIEIVVRDLSAL